MSKCLCGKVESKEVFSIVKWKVNKNIKILKCIYCHQYRTDPPPLAQKEDTEKLYDVPDYFLGAEINPQIWLSMQEELINNILEFKKSGRLLDIGCGMGFMSEMGQRMGFVTKGIDVNPHAIKKGKEMFPQLDISCSSLDSLENESFDIIVLNHVLEHILEPASFLFEVKKKLKQDGIIVLGVPNIEGGIPKILRFLNHFPWIPGGRWKWFGYQLEQHIWHFTPSTLKQILEKNGWVIKKVHSDLNMYYGATDLPQFRYKIIKYIWKFFEVIKKGDNLCVIISPQ